MPHPFELWIMGLGHRLIQGHSPDYTLLEVQVTASKRVSKLECLNCDRRPGPSSRVRIPVPSGL